MGHYVYILRCGDNSLYTGWTNNLENRLKMHKTGHGAKYTKGRGPIDLVYFEVFSSKSEALKREYEVKQLTKEQKEKLIKSKNGK
jgi:putative endonuclease